MFIHLSTVRHSEKSLITKKKIYIISFYNVIIYWYYSLTISPSKTTFSPLTTNIPLGISPYFLPTWILSIVRCKTRLAKYKEKTFEIFLFLWERNFYCDQKCFHNTIFTLGLHIILTYQIDQCFGGILLEFFHL